MRMKLVSAIVVAGLVVTVTSVRDDRIFEGGVLTNRDNGNL